MSNINYHKSSSAEYLCTKSLFLFPDTAKNSYHTIPGKLYKTYFTFTISSSIHITGPLKGNLTKYSIDFFSVDYQELEKHFICISSIDKDTVDLIKNLCEL